MEIRGFCHGQISTSAFCSKSLKLIRRQSSLVENTAQSAQWNISGMMGHNGHLRSLGGDLGKLDVTPTLGHFNKPCGHELSTYF